MSEETVRFLFSFYETFSEDRGLILDFGGKDISIITNKARNYLALLSF